jgi:hypothetical protein
MDEPVSNDINARISQIKTLQSIRLRIPYDVPVSYFPPAIDTLRELHLRIRWDILESLDLPRGELPKLESFDFGPLGDTSVKSDVAKEYLSSQVIPFINSHWRTLVSLRLPLTCGTLEAFHLEVLKNMQIKYLWLDIMEDLNFESYIGEEFFILVLGNLSNHLRHLRFCGSPGISLDPVVSVAAKRLRFPMLQSISCHGSGVFIVEDLVALERHPVKVTRLSLPFSPSGAESIWRPVRSSVEVLSSILHFEIGTDFHPSIVDYLKKSLPNLQSLTIWLHSGDHLCHVGFCQVSD